MRLAGRAPADEPLQNKGPVIRVQTGHSGPVVRIFPLPDGKHVITASVDQSIRIWDVETGKELRRLSGGVSNILALDVSADGNRGGGIAERGRRRFGEVVLGSAPDDFADRAVLYFRQPLQPLQLWFWRHG